MPEVLQRYVDTHPPRNQIDAALYRIAQHRIRLADISTSAAERTESIDALLAERTALIDSHPQHADRPIWLADQATDVFFLAWQDAGAGTTALFGLPTASQKVRAASAVRSLLDLSQRAESAIGQAIVQMEQDPDFATDESLRKRKREFDERERERRIPFLRGVTACLAAELGIGHEAQRASQYVLAAAVLPPLAEFLDGAPAAEASTLGGLALARLGRFDDAETQFRAVATDPDARAIDVFAARMGAVINREVRGGPDAGLEAIQSILHRYDSDDDLFFRIILADRQLMLRARIANGRQPLFDEAVRAYLAIRSGGNLPHGVRAVMIEKLASIAELWPDQTSLPVNVQAARSIAALQGTETAGNGLSSLTSMLDDSALHGSLRSAALLAIGRAQWRSGESRDAVRTLLQLAREHDDAAESETAIELAAGIAASEYGKAPQSPQVQALLSDALELLLRRFPNLQDLDRWRLLAGRVAVQQGDDGAAAAHFEAIAPSEDFVSWLEAQSLLVQIELAKLRDAPNPAKDERYAALVDQIDRVIQRVSSGRTLVASERGSHEITLLEAKLRIQRAEAMSGLGRADDAIQALDALEQSASLSIEVTSDLLRVKLTAYQSLGRAEDVQHELRRYLDASPREAPAVLAGLLQSFLDEVQGLLNEARFDEARRMARNEIEPIAALADAWLRQAGTTIDDAQLSILIADSFREAQRFNQALERYDALLRAHPDSLQPLLGRAECLFGIGGDQLGEAIRLYQRISATATDPDDPLYWQTQLRMLQILDMAGRNTQQIAPQIRRLRLLDPKLGGERYRRQLESLQNKYAR